MIELDNRFVNILTLSKRHKVTKTNLINLLKDLDLIDGSGKLLKSNSKFIKIDKENVLINNSFFYNEIISNDKFSNFVLTLNDNKPIHEIKDDIIRLKKLNEASKKRLLFLDFEFVANQYYEVAFQVVDNGVLIQKGYFFEEKALEQQFISENGFYNCINKIVTKTNQLKMNKKNINKFDILSRSKINFILSDVIKDIDYMIAHHSNSELQVLKTNNIIIPKEKTICTDKLFISQMEKLAKNGIKKSSMKLIDILEFFDVKIDPSKLHYAYYDVEVLKTVFFNIVDYFNKQGSTNVK